jgi:hypothetical protein
MEIVAGATARIERMEQGDAAGFWEQVRRMAATSSGAGVADLHSCGMPDIRAALHYQQWNIDPRASSASPA